MDKTEPPLSLVLQRQELMQSEMERIAGVEELSSDVREIISKSLQSPELATSQEET